MLYKKLGRSIGKLNANQFRVKMLLSFWYSYWPWLFSNIVKHWEGWLLVGTRLEGADSAISSQVRQSAEIIKRLFDGSNFDLSLILHYSAVNVLHQAKCISLGTSLNSLLEQLNKELLVGGHYLYNELFWSVFKRFSNRMIWVNEIDLAIAPAFFVVQVLHRLFLVVRSNKKCNGQK